MAKVVKIKQSDDSAHANRFSIYFSNTKADMSTAEGFLQATGVNTTYVYTIEQDGLTEDKIKEMLFDDKGNSKNIAINCYDFTVSELTNGRYDSLKLANSDFLPMGVRHVASFAPKAEALKLESARIMRGISLNLWEPVEDNDGESEEVTELSDYGWQVY